MKIFIWSIIVIAIAGGLLFALKSDNIAEAPSSTISGIYDTFARCIKDSGAIFYGASWCSHCKDQKEAFGTSAHLLPYVECATATGQTQICEEKKITGYPTWIFKDESRLSGKLEMQVLSEKTGCELPINATSTPVTQ
jgi:hypothetical protein